MVFTSELWADILILVGLGILFALCVGALIVLLFKLSSKPPTRPAVATEDSVHEDRVSKISRQDWTTPNPHMPSKPLVLERRPNGELIVKNPSVLDKDDAGKDAVRASGIDKVTSLHPACDHHLQQASK